MGASGELLGAPKTFPNRSRRLSRRPPAPQLDFGSILGPLLAPFWDPLDLKKQGFRMEGVAFFEKSKGSEKHLKMETWLSWNGKRVKGESRKHYKRKKRREEKQERREDLDLSCLVLSCPVVSCLAVSCLVLSRPVWSRLVRSGTLMPSLGRCAASRGACSAAARPPPMAWT